MAKIYKLTKGSQTIYPATTTDAVVNPNTRKDLTTELSELEEKIGNGTDEIASRQFSVNKWDGGTIGIYDANGVFKNTDSYAQYLSTIRIKLQPGDTLQCGYSTDVGENGILKNWFISKPNYVSIWRSNGHYERLTSSQVSFPYNASEDCEIVYSWYIGTSQPDDFKLNAYNGMIVIQESQPTAYIQNGTTLNPSIKLRDYYNKEEILANFVSKNDSSYTELQSNVELISNNFNKIKELQLPASYFRNGYGINDGGALTPSSSVACVEFIRFNPSEPVTLASSSGDKTLLKVLVYNEASENASEIHTVSLSNNKFDAKQYPDCIYFRFSYTPRSVESWVAEGFFGMEIETGIDKGQIDSIEASVSRLENLTSPIEEITLPETKKNSGLNASGKVTYAYYNAITDFIPFDNSVPVTIIFPTTGSYKIYRFFVYSDPSENADVIVQINSDNNVFDATSYSSCKYFRFCISPAHNPSGVIWKAQGIFGVVIKTEQKIESENTGPVSSGAIFEALNGLSHSINDARPYHGLSAESRFLIKREKINRQINGNTYYLSSQGSDEHPGDTRDKPFRSLNKAFSALIDGDVLLIERGSEFRDDFSLINNLQNIRISAYGLGKNPIINYLSVLTDWEKVEGYNHIYRCKVHAYQAVADRGMNQVYLDGERMCSVYDTNSMEEAEAMTYLDAHADKSSWFSGGKYIDGWSEQDCYYYISLSDSPENHTIEANRFFSKMLIGSDVSCLDFRHLILRGSGSRDGVAVGGDNIFWEDCTFMDHQHHGVVFKESYFLNCETKSSKAQGYQYHFLTSSGLSENIDLICANCRVINPGQLGSAFSGHNGGFTMEYSNWYIENCYVEGCGSVIGDTSLVNHVHVYNITLKNSGSLRGSTGLENKITYCTVFGTIVQNIGNNGLLVGGTEIKDIELINARIKIKVTDTTRQVGYSLYYKSVTNSKAIESLKICNSVIEWEMPESFIPTTAIFVSVDNTLDNARCNFDNVIFASDKNLLLGRVDTVHFTNSLFTNVILAGVSKSDVLQDCMEISKNDYDYSCLVSRARVNNGVLVVG